MTSATRVAPAWTTGRYVRDEDARLRGGPYEVPLPVGEHDALRPGKVRAVRDTPRDSPMLLREPVRYVEAEPQLYSGAKRYRMVASGFGVAIVACPLVSMTQPVGVVFKPLREPSPRLALVAA